MLKRVAPCFPLSQLHCWILVKLHKNWLRHWQGLLLTMNYDPKKLRLLFYMCVNVCPLVHSPVCTLILPYISLSSFSLFWYNWIVRTVLSLVMMILQILFAYKTKQIQKTKLFCFDKMVKPYEWCLFLFPQLSLHSSCNTMIFPFWWYLCRYISLQKYKYTKSFLNKN